jgi:hypothetical protein
MSNPYVGSDSYRYVHCECGCEWSSTNWADEGRRCPGCGVLRPPFKTDAEWRAEWDRETREWVARNLRDRLRLWTLQDPTLH